MASITAVAFVVVFAIIIIMAFIFLPKGKNFLDHTAIPPIELDVRRVIVNTRDKVLMENGVWVVDEVLVEPPEIVDATSSDDDATSSDDDATSSGAAASDAPPQPRNCLDEIKRAVDRLRVIGRVVNVGLYSLPPDTVPAEQSASDKSIIRCAILLRDSGARESGIWVGGEVKYLGLDKFVVFRPYKPYKVFNNNFIKDIVMLYVDIHDTTGRVKDV